MWNRTRAGLAGAALTLLGAGCFPKPYSSSLTDVVGQLTRHYDTVFPDATRGDAVGVLRPRFGIPAITTDRSFLLQVLERGPQAPIDALVVRGDLTARDIAACRRQPTADCARVELTEQPVQTVDGWHRLRTFVARVDEGAAVRGYDLVVFAASGSERLRRAVFLREPGASDDLTVVQISDPHIGRWGQRDSVVRRLDRAVSAINQLRPDLVLVTGDLAEEGSRRALELTARNALLQLEAPVLVVMGNHDYGHWPRVVRTDEPDLGYYPFAGVFHGLRIFTTTVGNWDFVGFDTGPALYSPRIPVRGLAPDTQVAIDRAIDDAARAGHGTVLFSHAPTRGAFGDDPRARGSHRLGSMAVGGERLERSMLEAAKRGQRVVHVSGHTHWSDAFVAKRDRSDFSRVAFDQLPCEVPLDSGAALISAPSVTRISFPTLRHGNAFGMVVLRLRKEGTTARFLLLDRKEQPLRCPN